MQKKQWCDQLFGSVVDEFMAQIKFFYQSLFILHQIITDFISWHFTKTWTGVDLSPVWSLAWNEVWSSFCRSVKLLWEVLFIWTVDHRYQHPAHIFFHQLLSSLWFGCLFMLVTDSSTHWLHSSTERDALSFCQFQGLEKWTEGWSPLLCIPDIPLCVLRQINTPLILFSSTITALLLFYRFKSFRLFSVSLEVCESWWMSCGSSVALSFIFWIRVDI